MRAVLSRVWHAVRERLGEAQRWLELGRDLAALGPTPQARRRIRRLAVWLPLRDGLPAPRAPRRRRMTLALGDLTVDWWVRRRTDLAVGREVLLDGEYGEVPLRAPVRVVLDLGSHIGFSVLFFRVTYPDARIIAVEPDPATAECLRMNVESLTGVEVHDVAVTSTDGAVDFHPATQAWISSLRDRGDGSTPIRVRGQSLDSLLAELDIHSVDLLKIDVEGEELAVLGASTRLDDVRAIVGELHDPAELPRLRELLSDYDVELRNVTDDHIAFSAVRTGQDARRTR